MMKQFQSFCFKNYKKKEKTNTHLHISSQGFKEGLKAVPVVSAESISNSRETEGTMTCDFIVHSLG